MPSSLKNPTKTALLIFIFFLPSLIYTKPLTPTFSTFFAINTAIIKPSVINNTSTTTLLNFLTFSLEVRTLP